jgi:hypothetical protein
MLDFSVKTAPFGIIPAKMESSRQNASNGVKIVLIEQVQKNQKLQRGDPYHLEIRQWKYRGKNRKSTFMTKNFCFFFSYHQTYFWTLIPILAIILSGKGNFGPKNAKNMQKTMFFANYAKHDAFIEKWTSPVNFSWQI